MPAYEKTAKIYCTKFGVVDYTQPDSVIPHSSIAHSYGSAMAIPESYFGFDVPDDLKFKEIVDFDLNLYVSKITQVGSSGKTSEDLRMGSSYGSWDPSTITWNNAPTYSAIKYTTVSIYSPTGYTKFAIETSKDFIWRYPFDYGCVLDNSMVLDVQFHTDLGHYRPYIQIYYNDRGAALTPSSLSPASGYVPRRNAAHFTWSIAIPKTIAGNFPEVVKFRWREFDDIPTNVPPDTPYNELPAEHYSITIPANTFHKDWIQWQVVVTATSGVVSTSDWQTVRTFEVAGSSSAISPVDIVLDNQSPIEFRWEHRSVNGTAQTRFELQYSTDGETWLNLASADTNEQKYTVPAGTFGAGDIFWRVRTYNIDSKAGPWSDVAKFIAFGAPETPSIAVVSTEPQWEIRWTQNGQQGFEVEFDGVVVASVYSAVANYKYKEWAEDGNHTVRVRIQNQYSMWSKWAEASLPILNIPGSPIMLSVSAGRVSSAELSWDGASPKYIVYRNGKKIAQTTASEFSDPFGVGTCAYQVRGISDSSGYYVFSNIATISVIPESLMLFDIRHNDFIPLALSEIQSRETTETKNHEASFLHFVGSRTPSVEFGDLIERNVAFDCAFPVSDKLSISKFENALGGMNCLKIPDGTSIIGAMTTTTCRRNQFYLCYQSSIIESEFDEVAWND